MRNFYSCSVGEKDKGYDQENLKRIIDNKAFVLHENTPQKGHYDSIKEDDILLLKYRGNFIAYGEALKTSKTDDEGWNLFAGVKNWCFHDALNTSLGVPIYGMQEATLGGSQYGTVKPLESNFSIDKIKNIDKESQLYQIIKQEMIEFKEATNMKGKIDILKYKKQIILQGPPGTGKTRMAKKLAFELTKSEVKLSPLEYIEWYIKNFKISRTSKERNLNQHQLLKEFSESFPVEKLSQITLEDYCLGKGSTTSFCYWIEVVLKGLGRFSPGAAGTTVYGVYFSKDEQDYKSTSKTPEELIKDIQIALSELIEKEDYSKAKEQLRFRYSFILKILNSYFPEKYFPIVSHEHLKAIANIFGIDIKGLDDVEINKKINDIFLELKEKHSSSISSLDLMGHLYLKFKIKKGEFNDVQIEVVEELGETKLIQFHPAYSYEDFVRGIVAETNEKSQVEYKVVNKILADLAQNALENPATNHVLIIDEINRANLPSVLGELIYALEYRYDQEKKNAKEATVESIYALKQNENDLEGDNTLMLPTNLYIIGTMNTADRSVGHIDYAIRRRFALVDVLPKVLINEELNKDSSEKELVFAEEQFKSVSELFIKNDVTLINDETTLNPSDFLSDEFKPKDVWLGHSYFIHEKDKFHLNLKYEIKPILKEYVTDGILKDSGDEKVLEKIEAL